MGCQHPISDATLLSSNHNGCERGGQRGLKGYLRGFTTKTKMKPKVTRAGDGLMVTMSSNCPGNFYIKTTFEIN